MPGVSLKSKRRPTATHILQHTHCNTLQNRTRRFQTINFSPHSHHTLLSALKHAHYKTLQHTPRNRTRRFQNINVSLLTPPLSSPYTPSDLSFLVGENRRVQRGQARTRTSARSACCLLVCAVHVCAAVHLQQLKALLDPCGKQLQKNKTD